MTLPRPSITFRANRDGTVHAAYLGKVRVGYVVRRDAAISAREPDAAWLWWTSLLRPTGGQYCGASASLLAAEESLGDSAREWLACALDSPPDSPTPAPGPAQAELPLDQGTVQRRMLERGDGGFQ